MGGLGKDDAPEKKKALLPAHSQARASGAPPSGIIWYRWNVDRTERDMAELDVDCLLFLPVEGTAGSNPEWGEYSVVACCWGCMHLAVFGWHM